MILPSTLFGPLPFAIPFVALHFIRIIFLLGRCCEAGILNRGKKYEESDPLSVVLQHITLCMKLKGFTFNWKLIALKLKQSRDFFLNRFILRQPEQCTVVPMLWSQCRTGKVHNVHIMNLFILMKWRQDCYDIFIFSASLPLWTFVIESKNSLCLVHC